jgi:serine/threonine protein kinase
MTEFAIHKKLGEITKYVTKGIRCEKVADTENKSVRIEALFEYGGHNLLKMSLSGINEELVIIMAQQSASAMELAHAMQIFHSDLKPENMMCDNGILKIIDFGVSKAIQRTSEFLSPSKEEWDNIIGVTKRYCPPECIYLKDVEIVPQAFDIYCWGMTFYQVITKIDDASLEAEWRPKRATEATYKKFIEDFRAVKWGATLKPAVASGFLTILSVALDYSPKNRGSFRMLYQKLLELLTLPHSDNLCGCKTGDAPVEMSCSHFMCLQCVGRQKRELLRNYRYADTEHCVICSTCKKKGRSVSNAVL